MTTMQDLGGTPLLVGVDIGGTKTRIRFGSKDAWREAVYPSASWRKRDWGEDAETLLAMCAQLVEHRAVSAIGIGAHGCDDTDECVAFEAEFTARTSAPVTVVNDAELMPLALGHVRQIGLVAGTGSIAVCRGPSGDLLAAGGWGWAIGDEGSAAGLVREAARTVALHLDLGGAESEPLTAALFTSMHITSAPRVGSTLANLGNAAAIGSHARAVFEAADNGSNLARQVIAEGGAALAQLVERLVVRGADVSHVVAGGSVIVSQPRLWQAFCLGLEALRGQSITPHLFTGEPVEGAFRLAEAIAAADQLKSQHTRS